MTVRELYEFAVGKGIDLDMRGPEALRRHLHEVRADYDRLDEKAKLRFDKERFSNPFGDTRLVSGDPDAVVRRLICGIDITGAEVLMADAMRQHGKPVDLVLGHHAIPGGCLASRFDTVWPQARMLTDFGVPAHKAEKLIRKTIGSEERSVDFRTNQIAEALGLPLMTIHSPADICFFHEGYRVLREEQPKTLGDLVECSDAWPEVRWLLERGQGTQIAVGDARDPIGKVYACFYGGYNPTPEVFEAICEAGCGTLWVVATSEELNAVARKHNASIVVVPHYPADNVGLNLLFDAAMERFGAFDVVGCSNYVRISRRSREA